MPASFSTYPPVYPVPSAPHAVPFRRSVLKRATSALVHLAMLGDSQESSNAEGRFYSVLMQSRLAIHAGHLAGTGWSPPGSAAQPTPFIRQAHAHASTTTAPGLTTSDFPPFFNFPMRVTSSGTLSFCLQPDAIGTVVANGSGVYTESQFMQPRDLIDLNAGDLWVADILLLSRAYTSEAVCGDTVAWEIRKHTGSVPNVSGTLVTSGTATNAALNNGSTKSVVKVTTTAFALDPSNKYITLVVKSNTGDPVVVSAVRFRNVSRPRGIAITWMGVGGATSATFQATYNDCGPLLTAMGLDAMATHYGANDAYSGTGLTAAAYKTNIRSLIDRIRQLTGKSLPCALFNDPWRPEDNSTEATYFDEEGGALAEIADADPLCRFCNTRLVTEKLGWCKASEDLTGISDGGAWTVTTAYTTSQYVTVTGANTMVFKCILNHTSAAADAPMTGANWRTYWQLVRKHGASKSDGVHYSFFGSQLVAEVDAGLLLTGVEDCPILD